MTYQSGYDLSNDPAWKERIEIAIVEASINVQAEDETALSLPAGLPTGTTQQQLHDKRSELAYSILNDPSGYAVLFAKGVASDPNNAGVSGASTDADILFTVNSIFNAYAINGAAL